MGLPIPLATQPTASILFSTPSPISGDESKQSRIVFHTPHPYTGGEGCGIEPRRVPNGTCASRKREATTPPTTTHLIEIDHNWRFSSPLDRQVFHNPTHAVVSRPGQAGLEVWLYSSIESSQRTRTLTHPSHASFSCLLPSSTPSLSRPLLHHLLSSTLQHSCSCSNPRHRSPPC